MGAARETIHDLVGETTAGAARDDSRSRRRDDRWGGARRFTISCKRRPVRRAGRDGWGCRGIGGIGTVGGMKVDATLTSGLTAVGQSARDLEAAGYSGVWSIEAGHD